MPASHPSPRFGYLAGGIAMLGALLVLRALSPLTEVRPLAESLADGLLLLLPVEVFARLKSALGDQAKTWLLIGILLGFVVVGCLLGRWIATGRNLYARATQAAAGLFVAAVVSLFLIDRDQLRDAFLLTVGSLAIASLVFAAIAIALLRPIGSTEPDSVGRRRMIAGTVGSIAAVVLGRDVWTLWGQQAETSPEVADATGTPAITPIGSFYRISKNFVDPENDRGPDWTIAIAGAVNEERSWNQEELAALGFDHTITTMLCISNEVGGDLIGTAEWSGVPLATVLDTVGATGDHVLFTGADGYETCVPMERCLHPQAWLVWGMNGEPLPREHGAPVRAIIPGLYGMKSVKWLIGMDIGDENRLGYWEQRGWTNTAVVKPMSRIDFPRRSTNLVAGTIPVRGVAFGGDAGVERVEVSSDGGDTWQDARITEQPNPDGIAWSLWQFDWAAEAGTHTLVVRMIGKDGSVQTEDEASPIPDGSSGWHRVEVFVERF